MAVSLAALVCIGVVVCVVVSLLLTGGDLRVLTAELRGKSPSQSQQ